jgi:NADH-quinone oxidoreductase subunit H
VNAAALPSLAIELAYWQQTVLRSIGVLVAVLIPAGTLVYVFLFKMMSFMQSRLGPMEAGPYGSMQLLAEVGKWIQKEDIVPWRADRKLFALAPYVVVATVFLILLAVPFGIGRFYIGDVGIGVEGSPWRIEPRRSRHQLGPSLFTKDNDSP